MKYTCIGSLFKAKGLRMVSHLVYHGDGNGNGRVILFLVLSVSSVKKVQLKKYCEYLCVVEQSGSLRQGEWNEGAKCCKFWKKRRTVGSAGWLGKEGNILKCRWRKATDLKYTISGQDHAKYFGGQ